MQGGGGNKKRFQYCTGSSGQEILYLRALQGHSGRNLKDPELQDNVLIPNDLFENKNHIGCAINLHSIMNSGLIPGGQNLSKRHSILHACGSYEQRTQRSWYSRPESTASSTVPRLAQKKGFKFHQTRSNAIILNDTLPAYCIPKAIMMETGEIIYEKVYASLRLLRRFPLKTIGCRNWVQKLPDMVKTLNKPKPNERPQIQKLEQGDLFRQNNRPVRVLRKSTNVSYVAAKAPMKEQDDLLKIVCQCLLNV